MRRRVAPVVVRLQRSPEGKLLQTCDVYIEHAWTRNGWSLPESKWASPFPGKDAETMLRYEQYARSQLMPHLHELDGHVLGCWCRIPEDQAGCHGQVLLRLWKETFPDHDVQLDLGQRLFSADGALPLAEPPGGVPQKVKGQRPKRPNATNATTSATQTRAKKPKRIRNQTTHPQGLTKAGQKLAWPVLDHEWNASTIWIDEAGMGCWAGPLHVAGTILLPGFNVQGLIDSKLLEAHEREHAFAQLQTALAEKKMLAHIESMSNTEVDRLKLGGAWREAIRRIIVRLKAEADAQGLVITRVVLDGNKTVNDTALPITPIPKADRLYAGVSAAAILAKVSRDRFMTSVAPQYPEFQEIFDEGSGYHHSNQHNELLHAGKHTDLHRKSFDPLRSILASRVLVIKSPSPPQAQAVYRLEPTSEKVDIVDNARDVRSHGSVVSAASVDNNNFDNVEKV